MKRSSLLRYAGIGALAGARWSSGPSVLADELRRAYIEPATSASKRTNPLERGLRMLSRLERYEARNPGALVAVAKGAVSAGAVAASERRGWASGAALGAFAAAVAALGTSRIRTELGRQLGLDPATLSAAERKVADAVEQEVRGAPSESTRIIDLDV